MPNERNQQNQREHNRDVFDANAKFRSNWITRGLDSEAIEFCEKAGKKLCDEKMSTSQIRNVYGEIVRMKMKGIDGDNYQSFLLLKPKVAYAAKRAEEKKQYGVKHFKKILDLAHEKVLLGDKDSRPHYFNNFCDMMEAILAFHKSFGGKDY